MRSKQQGFTLIELMITVAVVAILAAIAYPSYKNQIMRSRRTDAKAALLNIQVAQEKRFLATNAYVQSTTGLTDTWASGGLGLAQAKSDNGYYNLTIDAGATAISYVARAKAPTGSGQASDSCGEYTINNTGAKTPTTAGCW